jgi:hypothetical protein
MAPEVPKVFSSIPYSDSDKHRFTAQPAEFLLSGEWVRIPLLSAEILTGSQPQIHRPRGAGRLGKRGQFPRTDQG